MTDEALRAAQREARARPDDRAAREAYLRALERAGRGPESRRAFWSELCRRARAGDATADDTLERWAASGSLDPLAAKVDLARAWAIVIPRPASSLATPVVLTRAHALCVAEAVEAYDLWTDAWPGLIRRDVACPRPRATTPCSWRASMWWFAALRPGSSADACAPVDRACESFAERP